MGDDDKKELVSRLSMLLRFNPGDHISESEFIFIQKTVKEVSEALTQSS